MTTLASTLLIIFAAFGAISLGVWITFIIQHMVGIAASPAEIELAFVHTTSSNLIERNEDLESQLQKTRSELDLLQNTIITKLLTK